MYTRYEQLKTERGVTDYQVAKATGIAPATFYNWKKGFYKPKIGKLMKIAEYFGVPISYFLEGEPCGKC